MKNPQLEICCYSIQSVINANDGCADRIELCTDYFSGGTTPSAGLINQAIRFSKTPVYIMIRPRGGDFFYSDDEIEIMLRDIAFVKSSGAAGVVFGCLKQDGNIDLENTKRLIEKSQPLAITFHRAIDMSVNPVESAAQLLNFGVNKILTSGGCAKAMEGIDTIKEMINVCGEKVSIMAGSGVNAENIPQLFDAGVREFHSSAASFIQSTMKFRNSKFTMGGKNDFDEFAIQVADVEKIKKIKTVITTLS